MNKLLFLNLSFQCLNNTTNPKQPRKIRIIILLMREQNLIYNLFLRTLTNLKTLSLKSTRIVTMTRRCNITRTKSSPTTIMMIIITKKYHYKIALISSPLTNQESIISHMINPKVNLTREISLTTTKGTMLRTVIQFNLLSSNTRHKININRSLLKSCQVVRNSQISLLDNN